jgi:exopolyphosphatase/guanosine-5'-triphosphate,3'-diphosphate pyrophosphatase
LPIFAAIDIGSNSVKLRVARRHDSDGTWEVLTDDVRVTGLGGGLATSGRLHPADMTASLQVFCEYTTRARELGATAIAAVGTMCLRRAANGAEFVARARTATGIAPEIIPGEEEARLSYLGARSALPELPPDVVMFDIGGGSTECMLGRSGRLAAATSVDVGTLHPTHDIFISDPVTVEQVAAGARWIAAGLAPAAKLLGGGCLVGIGGTAAVLAAVGLGCWRGAAAIIHGRRVDRGEIQRQIALYQALPVAARRALPGLPPDRADVILAGAMVARTLLSLAAAEDFVVSTHGLRQGLLADRFGGDGGPRRSSDATADPP